jgi:antitoxin VapB
MTSSRVFTSNRRQVVCLSKAVAFPADVHQVDILKIGHGRLIVPQGRRWDDLCQSGPRASDDFMAEREQRRTAEGPEPRWTTNEAAHVHDCVAAADLVCLDLAGLT